MLSDFQRRLLNNQLLLHARSRGPRVDRPGAICFEAGTTRQRYWLLERWVELPPDLRDVRILPGADVREDDLRAAGFEADGALRYLWTPVPDPTPAIPRPSGWTLATGSGARWSEEREPFLRSLSEIMCGGFASRAAGGSIPLEDTLQRNRRGAQNPDETAYLARIDGVPAAVARTFFADGLLGIYGVATLPAFQRRGLAGALLGAAFDEARARGAQWLTLQTWADSAPERLYRRFGFVPEFEVGLWVRHPSAATVERG